jgi:UDP-glucuronate decarboxylase
MADLFLASDIKELAVELGDVVDDFAGKTVLLAGGRGFLGRYFAVLFDELNRTRLTEPCRLVAVDDLITSGEAGASFSSDSHEFLRQDISVRFDFDEPVDYVVHAAGIASPFYYSAYPLETMDVAIFGSRHLLQIAAKSHARYTFFSSSEIYGDPDPAHVPTPESYRGNVASQGRRACYDESKRVGETLCYVFHNYFGVTTNIIRPFNIYGPGMQEDDYRVLPNFASAIKGGRQLSLYGSGSQTRSFCYITDAMNGFLRVISRGVPGETYNIGNPDPEIAMLELAERIGAVSGRPVDYRIIEYPDSYPGDEPNRRCPDIRKAHLQVGYRPVVDLDTGLQRFLSWADRMYTGRQ